jgi:hypothetical protein
MRRNRRKKIKDMKGINGERERVNEWKSELNTSRFESTKRRMFRFSLS